MNVKSFIEKYCVNIDKPALQCNGKCYLKKQLEFNTSDTYSEISSINFSEVFMPVYLHIAENYAIENLGFFQKNKIIFSNTLILQELIFYEVEYPPEIV